MSSANIWLPSGTSIALSLLLGLGLAGGYGYWRKAIRLEAWRREQESTTRSDLSAIKAIMLSVRPLDPNAIETIESLKKPGELIEQTTTEIRVPDFAADKADTNADAEADVSWSQEAGGFHRLRYIVDLDRSSSPSTTLTLTRRFQTPSSRTDMLLDWTVASILFTGSIFIVHYSAISSFRRQRLRQAIASWGKRMGSDQPVNSIPIDASLQQSDTAIAHSLAVASDEMQQRMLRTQNSVQQTSRVMSAMPIGVLAFDPMLKLLFVNRAGIELLGLSPTIQFGHPLIEVVRQPTVVDLVQRVATEFQSQEVDLEIPDRKLTLRLRALPLASTNSMEPPSRQAVLIAITDETRLKQLENARRDFTANVSHELKTPLSAIKAYAETLLIGALEDEQASRRFVERISEQANRLDILIRDLLHLTRLQSQPEKPPMGDLVLNDVLKTCVEEHATIGKSRNISIDVSGVDTCVRVYSNLESLRTVIGNLLSNAVRYNRDGGWVRVSTVLESEVVRLFVEDNGLGIPPEDLDRIFERFYRVEKARSQDLGGTGLGLSIVKHLVQSMTAEVRVRSTLAQGSCFELRLPSGNMSDA